MVTGSNFRMSRWWMVVAAMSLTLSACANRGPDDESEPAPPSAPPGEEEVSNLFPAMRCVDKDGDGFGTGCGNGADCDDGLPQITNECYSCAGNATGCPCKDGQNIKCGELTATAGGTPGCLQGEKVCENGKWSACRVGSKTATPLQTKDLGSNISCADNPCDPYCQHFPDDPDPGLTNDSGIVGTEAGLILTATPVDAGPPEECVNESVEAEPIPLDMYIMLDRSGSMAGSRWTNVKSAINTFVNEPSSAGVTIALDYFSGNTCPISEYSTPSVDWGLLPANAGAITTSLNANSPSGNTPTGPALQGAINFATTRANSPAGQGHKVIVVLATDGQPTVCTPIDVNLIGNIADAGFTATPSIQTFVIGVGPSVANLNLIALRGGTPGAYMVDGGSAQFLAAMQDIRNQSLGCEYTVPANPSTGNIDPDATEVSIKFGSGGTPTNLTQYADQASCAGGDGFYFDNPHDPSILYLCPDTCTTVQGDSNWIVDLTFLCHANCADFETSIEPVPLDLTVMLDKSGSMDWGNRWTNTTNALKAFVNDSSSAGVFMALDYFPASPECSISSYASTVSVPWSELPGSASTFISSLNSTSPGGGTPTEPALTGAIEYARQRSIAYPDHAVAVVLATDGEPNNCSSDVNGVAAVAAAGLSGTGSSTSWSVSTGSTAFEDIHTGGNHTWADSDDETRGSFPIGFSFPYHGTSYTTFWVNTNGFLALATAPASSAYTNYQLPDGGSGAIIAPFWDDLVVDDDVYYSTLGTAPNRRLVVQWRTARHYSGAGTMNFEAILFENGDIEFRYQQLDGGYGDGWSASVGVADALGLQGYGYSHNQSVLYPGLSIYFDQNSSTTSYPPIKTYVIGVGYTAGLNTIAAAGGTGSAFLVSNSNATTEFLAAMQDIRAQQMTCEYAIPPSSLGVVDPETLDVRFTPSNGDAPTDFPLLPGAANCGSGHGFYYDDPNAPTMVTLCAASCSMVQADSSAQLNIFYDCLGNYPDGVFVRDYSAEGLCPPGSSHIWTNWHWDAETPSNSYIDFTVAVSDTLAGLVSAPEANLRFSNPPGPSAYTGANIGAKAGTPDTQSGWASVDTTLSVEGMNRKAPFLRVRAKLYASAPNNVHTPILKDWEMEISCEASE